VHGALVHVDVRTAPTTVEVFRRGKRVPTHGLGELLSVCQKPTFRPPDLAPHFLPGGENGLSYSFRWPELRRWGRRCRLPARTESGPLFELGSSEGEHRLPHCGLTANSTTSGVLTLSKVDLEPRVLSRYLHDCCRRPPLRIMDSFGKITRRTHGVN
jgi:hypothetical protein